MPRLLIEIGHAGHVHFFKHAISMLKNLEWDITLFSREKPNVTDLLTAEGLKGYKIEADASNIDKFLGLVPRVIRVSKIVRQEGIDLMAGVHPVHAALASRLTGVPCIGFADTEHALEQIVFYAPNCKKIHTPRAFRRSFGSRHKKYPGYQELAYLHPQYFTPDKGLIEEYGVLDQGAPILLRLIKWDATHDLRVKNRSWEDEFIEKFSKDHRIFISSEGKMPRKFEHLSNPLPPHLYHHLLAELCMYVGPGATSASESAMLGVPAIYTNPLKLGYISELESRYGLVFQSVEIQEILDQAETFLDRSRQSFILRKNKMLSESCDVTKRIVDALRSEV